MTRSEPGTLSPVDKVLCLQHVDVFKYATTEMLAYISSIASEVRVTRNEVIFREGDVSYAMYVVVKGRVRLDKEDREVMTVDRKSTRLNSSHGYISYAVFCLKKK